MTYKWLAATVIAGVLAIGGMWLDLGKDIGSRPTRDEINARLDRFEDRLDTLLVPRFPEIQQTEIGAGQVQYVVVLPAESIDVLRMIEQERLRSDRIRELTDKRLANKEPDDGLH